jgi:hypothetical protein
MKAVIFLHSFAAFVCMALSLASTAYNAAAAVALNSVGSTWDAYGNYLSVFTLTNASDEAMSYSGYAPSEPIYTTQVRRIAQWSDEPAGWCGVGLGTQRLAPNQSVTFTVPPPDGDQTWRVGVRFNFTGSDSKSRRSETAWSSPVTSKSRKQIDLAAPDAASLVQTAVTWHPDSKFPYTFRLTNSSAKTLFFGGYRETDVPPIYLNQERQRGHWRDDGHADWCGSGFGFKQLRPGDSLTFSIPAQSLDHSWRIGILLFRNGAPRAPDDAYRPVWWPELPPRGKTPKIGAANGASHLARSEI